MKNKLLVLLFAVMAVIVILTAIISINIINFSVSDNYVEETEYNLVTG